MTIPSEDLTLGCAVAYWGEKNEPDAICAGPVLDSRDGEYREFLVRHTSLTNEYGEGLFSKWKDGIETELLKCIGEGKIEIDVRPLGATEAQLKFLEDNRLGILCCVSYISHLFYSFPAANRETYHFTEAHLKLATFLRKQFDAHKIDVEFLTKRIDKPFLSDVHQFLYGRMIGGNRNWTIKQGTKTIPLTKREVSSPYELSLPTWREYWTTEMCGDLVLNLIAPGFCSITSTSLLKNAIAPYYDNPAMHAKLGRRGAAQEMAKSLRFVRTMAAAESAKIRAADPRGASLFDNLDARVYGAIDYEASHISPTDVALLIALEFVGYTIYDKVTSRIPAQLVYGDESGVIRGNQHLIKPDYVDKIIFDWVWSVYCMHDAVGVAHGDIHANNITVFGLAKSQLMGTKPDGPVILYVDSQDNAYALPYVTRVGFLIDFSRVILGPKGIKRAAVEMDVGRAEVLRRDQTPRVLELLRRWAPTAATRCGEKLRDFVLEQPDGTFAAVSAGDFIALGETLKQVANLMEKSKKNIYASGLFRRRGEAIMRAARRWISRALKEVAEDGEYMTGTAGCDIMAEVWAHRRVPVKSGAGAGAAKSGAGSGAGAPASDTPWTPESYAKRKVVELWTTQRPVRHTGRYQKDYPPWAKLANYIPHLGDEGLESHFGVVPMHAPGFGDTAPERDALVDESREALDPSPMDSSDAWLYS